MTIFILLLLFYFGTVIYGLYIAGIYDLYKTASKQRILIFGTITIIFILIIMSLMAREKFVYYWDYGSYWHMTTHDGANLSKNSFVNSLKWLISSINRDDYNRLATFILAFPLKLFGGTYFAFVLLNVCLFYIPNTFVLSFTLKKISEQMNFNVTFLTLYIFSITFTIPLFPILNGYVDIIGMLPLSMSFLLIIDRNFDKIDVKKDLILGISILWVMLLRRYFNYAVIGCAIFAFFYWISFGSTKNKLFYKLKIKFIDMGISVAIPIFVSLLFFRGFLKLSIFNNHLEAYSAYKSTNMAGEFLLLFKYFGMFFSLLAIAGIILSIKNGHFRFIISLFLGFLLTCVMFFRIQNMGQHHYYIIVFPMYVFIFLGIKSISNILKEWLSPFCIKILINKKTYTLFLVPFFLSVICVANFLFSLGFIPPKMKIKSDLWVSNVFRPRVRNDIDELNRMENYLGQLDLQGYKGVYCLASSGILNDDIMRKLHAPDYSLPYSSFGVAHVDLRDGFSINFFKADVLIACNPVQYHLSHGQEMIHELNKIMLEENEFSNNYELTNEFYLDCGVKAFVYVRKDRLEKKDIIFIRDKMDFIHCEHPELFRNKIEDYMQINFK